MSNFSLLIVSGLLLCVIIDNSASDGSCQAKCQDQGKEVAQEENKYLPPVLETMHDVIKEIDRQRIRMFETNPLFPLLKNDSLSLEQRLSFAPYMLFFSVGCPDVMTLIMKIDKPDNELNDLERRINTFVKEDNFHYNFYLKDFENLGYTLERFGSAQGVVRHVFASEAIPVRKLIYGLVHSLRRDESPLVGMTLMEILEAGLFDLFVTAYVHITPKFRDSETLPTLHYYGDTHVQLEQEHSVTSWFIEDKTRSDPLKEIKIPAQLSPTIQSIIDEMMSHFDSMYYAFEQVVIGTTEPISPEKYEITSNPPMDYITRKEAAALET